MKYVVLAFVPAFLWAGLVIFLTNAYLGGNFLLGAPVALVGAAFIGTGIGLWLRHRFRRNKTYWTD